MIDIDLIYQFIHELHIQWQSLNCKLVTQGEAHNIRWYTANYAWN